MKICPLFLVVRRRALRTSRAAAKSQHYEESKGLHLKKSSCGVKRITRICRGHIAFSERGQSVLAQNPAQISISLLLVGSDPEFMQETRHDLLRDLVS